MTIAEIRKEAEAAIREYDLEGGHEEMEKLCEFSRTTVPLLCDVIDMMRKHITRGYKEDVKQKADEILAREATDEKGGK